MEEKKTTDVKSADLTDDKCNSKPLKNWPSLKQMLPLLACLLTFATVLSVLIMYMDTTELRHQQFRLNMTRDYELLGVQQDNPNLISYIREIHMHKYPLHIFRKAQVRLPNVTGTAAVQKVANFIGTILLNNKTDGVFLQSFPAESENMMTAHWLVNTLNWTGYIVEPDPAKYFILRKLYLSKPKVQIIHACLSPNGFPKEVTIHHVGDDDINMYSVAEGNDESGGFYSRVKCFPLFTIMLAVNQTNIDVLSLGCNQQDLQILESVPFEKVSIKIITVYVKDPINNIADENNEIGENETSSYISNFTTFLKSKSYRLIKTIENNYIFIKK